jgi:hypothetical protein
MIMDVFCRFVGDLSGPFILRAQGFPFIFCGTKRLRLRDVAAH